jgi:hypothetical protein
MYLFYLSGAMIVKIGMPIPVLKYRLDSGPRRGAGLVLPLDCVG